MHHTYQCDADLSVGYEPICYCLAKRTINDSELTKLNDDYESLCRYLCGSDQLPYDIVMQKFNELSDSFFKVTVELNIDPTIRSRTEGMERNHLVFGLHRTVSFCLWGGFINGISAEQTYVSNTPKTLATVRSGYDTTRIIDVDQWIIPSTRASRSFLSNLHWDQSTTSIRFCGNTYENNNLNFREWSWYITTW